MDVESDWMPKLDAKTDLYVAQDGSKIDAISTYNGLQHKLSKRELAKVCTENPNNLEQPMLGSWEEGREEGKPSTISGML